MSRERRKGRHEALLPEAARPAAAVPRRLRVEGALRAQLAEAIARLEDPRLVSLVVTRVEMTDDLQLARVFVHLGAPVADDERARLGLLRGLRSAKSRLRRQVGAALGLRHTPELRFAYDEGIDAARRIDALLDELRREQG